MVLVLVDGKLYAGYNAVSKDKKYTPTLYTIDTNTWKLIGAEVLNDYSLMSFEPQWQQTELYMENSIL